MGKHLPGVYTGGLLFFLPDFLRLSRGRVSMLRFVFFVIVVVVLPRPHCRRSVFARAGSFAFFLDRVRASWAMCL